MNCAIYSQHNAVDNNNLQTTVPGGFHVYHLHWFCLCTTLNYVLLEGWWLSIEIKFIVV